MSEIKNLIKYVGMNLIFINVLWIGFLPVYIIQPIYCNFCFCGYKYSFNVNNISTLFQVCLTLKILHDIKNK